MNYIKNMISLKYKKSVKSRMTTPSHFCQNLGISLKLQIINYLLDNHQQGKNVEILSVSRETPILIRRRKEGDQLLVNGHHQKLRRWFINHKIPISLRQKALIIEQNHNILSVVGLVTSDLSQPSKSGIMKDSLYIQKIDR